MPHANAMVPPEAIRIEDEVWQEAFSRREPARSSRQRRLRAVEPEQADWLLAAGIETSATERTRAATPVASIAPADQAGTGLAARASVASAAPRAPVAGAAPSVVADVAPVTLADAAPVTVTGALPVTQAPAAPPARRTVKIQGRGAERHLPVPSSDRRRPPRRAYERSGFRPDRLAMWAVMLGFLLVLVAILSAHG